MRILVVEDDAEAATAMVRGLTEAGHEPTHAVDGAFGLLEAQKGGYDVYVVADAVGSRTQKNIDLAMDRLRQNGIFVVSTEMVIFEWLVRAGTPDFKMMQPIIK